MGQGQRKPEAGTSLRSKTLSPGGGPDWQPVGQALLLDMPLGSLALLSWVVVLSKYKLVANILILENLTQQPGFPAALANALASCTQDA